MFLSFIPPLGPFKYASAVSRSMRKRLRHGGIRLVGVGGAHLRRHSATQFVRRQRPINVVAYLVGPRSISTRALCVKVSASQRAEVAYHFPGRRRRMTNFVAFLGEKSSVTSNCAAPSTTFQQASRHACRLAFATSSALSWMGPPPDDGAGLRSSERSLDPG